MIDSSSTMRSVYSGTTSSIPVEWLLEQRVTYDQFPDFWYVWAMPNPSSAVSFRRIAMQSALILLMASTIAGIVGMHVTSRAVVIEQFEDTTRRQAELAVSHLDLIYEEAWRSLEFIEQDSYLVSLARSLHHEASPITRAQMAAEISSYLSLRYLRPTILAGLFIASDRFVIGSYTTDRRASG